MCRCGDLSSCESSLNGGTEYEGFGRICCSINSPVGSECNCWGELAGMKERSVYIVQRKGIHCKDI